MSSPSHQSGAGRSTCSSYWVTGNIHEGDVEYSKCKGEIQYYSPIVSPKHVNGIPVCHNSVFTAPKTEQIKFRISADCKHAVKSDEAASSHLSTCYLAPTNSSHGGSLLQRWTVSKGPKLRVKYSTLSEQLWSKSTLGATLVDLQDIVANSSS